TLRQLRQLLGPEQNQDDRQDENDFPAAKKTSNQSIHKRCLSDGDTRPAIRVCKAPIPPNSQGLTRDESDGRSGALFDQGGESRINSARRFLLQAASVWPVSAGFSSPKVMVGSISGSRPSATSFSRTDRARLSPSARLYS